MTSLSPYALMAELLRQLGLHRETIGLEKTYLSAASWEETRCLLLDMTILDCSAMMAQVRWIKTPGEMRLLKDAPSCLPSWAIPRP